MSLGSWMKYIRTWTLKSQNCVSMIQQEPTALVRMLTEHECCNCMPISSYIAENGQCYTFQNLI